MSPHIHIGPEPVLAAHARSLPAASRCPAGADSAPHSEQYFFYIFYIFSEQYFFYINDMYNNDVGKGVVYAYEAYEAK